MNRIWTIRLARINKLILKLLYLRRFKFHGMSQLMGTKTKDNFFMSLAWHTIIPAKAPNTMANIWMLRPELVVKQARGGQ